MQSSPRCILRIFPIYQGLESIKVGYNAEIHPETYLTFLLLDKYVDEKSDSKSSLMGKM